MKPHEEWLYKAENDIESAKYLLSSPKPLFDIAVYHTQQCAEKSLKAFLAFSEKEIDRTHNLKMLSEICAEIDESFNNLIDDCISLSPYATLYRYPDGELMPARSSVIDAVASAEKIMDFVKQKMTADNTDI